MLASPLLRVRTTKNGSITPLFCTRQEEIDLAERLIQEFTESWRKREKRSELESRIYEIESEYNIVEYKLVRGLCALLERRCTFGSGSSSSTYRDSTTRLSSASASASLTTIGRIDDNGNTSTKDYKGKDDDDDKDNIVTGNSLDASTLYFYPDPTVVRKALFEESSRQGFALTDLERKEIIDSVASRLHISTEVIANIMWSDLEDNLIIEQFDSLDAKTLIGWYNLSLIQTLLFSCTKLDFSVFGGLNWKRVLRSLKRLGLMYYLQEQNENEDQSKGKAENAKGKKIACSIEGPTSLFRLTDRYGTALAKLLPLIVLRRQQQQQQRPPNEGDRGGGEVNDNNDSNSSRWDIHAWILRKTAEGGRSLYEFKLSSSEAPQFLTDPFRFSNTSKSESSSFPSDYYDSAVEEKFARRFNAVASSSGWKLIREPDPLILSDGRALIPDFMFEKYGKRVYLEIVGFWTPEYLERKLKKLADVMIGRQRKGDTTTTTVAAITPIANIETFTIDNTTMTASVDLFVALNKDLACSNAVLSSLSLHVIPKEKMILYEKESVPVRPILDHLKSIDNAILEKNTSDPNLRIELDRTRDIVPIVETAPHRYIKGDNNINRKPVVLPPEIAMKIALRDYGNEYIDISGTYLISKSKIEKTKPLLVGINKFIDACAVLSQAGIPESCHAELLSKMGYDVLWQSMDPSTALIEERKKKDT